MAVLGLRFCARALSSCGKWGPLLIAVRGPFTIAASLVAEHRLQTRRLSNCGSQTQPLRGMWNLPRPGLEPVSPALTGRFSTAAPPGKPLLSVLLCTYSKVELLDYLVIFFYLFKDHHTFFFIVCTILHYHKPCTRVSTSPHPHQHFLFSVFFK